jgi:isopropylmalate/homocitrate/citramalate synthase
VVHALAQQGLRISERKIAVLLSQIKTLAVQKKDTVSVEELLNLYWALA